jgi:DNA polymerase I-like protein with 3'-5' exonuclease and polymerase domains
MARKGQRTFEPTATPLEDAIPLSYTLVGTQEWFDTAFDPDAFDPEQQLLVSSPADLAEPKEWLSKRPLLGVDTETTGPYFSDDKGYAMNPVNPDTRIVTLQVGDESHVWVIDPALIEEFREPLESTKHLHLAHHWLYDFKWLLVKNKIHILRMYCSMLVEQLLTAGKMGIKVGLADCSRRYEPNFIISKAVRSLFIHLNEGKMSREMIRYAARDIPLLFPVFREQCKQIDRLKLKTIAQLEFDVVPCTAEMEIGGVFLDTVKLQLLIKYWLERQDEMEKKIISLYSERRKAMGRVNFIIPELNEVFDLDSNKAKMEALKKIGIELDDVKRVTLLTVDDPIAKLLGEYSNVTKMTSTYGENMLQKINEYTGMWHPRFAQMGSGASEGDAQGRDSKETTATGRYVSDAQQFPRKQERYALETDPDVRAEVVSRFADIISQYQAKFEEKAA